MIRSLLDPDEEVNDAERQARRGHCDPSDLNPVHVVVDVLANTTKLPRTRNSAAARNKTIECMPGELEGILARVETPESKAAYR